MKKKKNLAEKFKYNVDEHVYECPEFSKDTCKHFRSNEPDEVLPLCKECFYDNLDVPYGNVMVKIPKEKKSQKVTHYICKYKEHTITTHQRVHILAQKDSRCGKLDKWCRNANVDEMEFMLQKFNREYRYLKDIEEKRYHWCLCEIVRDNLNYYLVYDKPIYEGEITGINDDGVFIWKVIHKKPTIYTVDYNEDYTAFILRDDEGCIITNYTSVDISSQREIDDDIDYTYNVDEIKYEDWEYWSGSTGEMK